MKDNDLKVVLNIIDTYNKELIGNLNTEIKEGLSKYNDYIAKRFDDIDEHIQDIENRLYRLEGRTDTVKKHTELLPKIFDILKIDEVDVANWRMRVSNLEK